MIPLDIDIRGDGEDDVADDDGDDNVIDFAVPSSDPIENKLKALSPEQQLPFNFASQVWVISQHINPPSPGHLSAHPRVATPFVAKHLRF